MNSSKSNDLHSRHRDEVSGSEDPLPYLIKRLQQQTNNAAQADLDPQEEPSQRQEQCSVNQPNAEKAEADKRTA